MMKALVLVWSFVNLFPAVTPFILFPVFFLIAHLIRNNLENIHSGLLFLAICGVIGAITYENFVRGPEHYNSFLEQRGAELDAAVTVIKKSESIFPSEDGNEVAISFQDESGTTIETSYMTHDRRYFPPLHAPVVPPEPGDRIRIRYYPGAETGFLVLSDPKKSIYGGKIACNEAKHQLAVAEKGFRFEDYASAERRSAFRKAIDTAIGMNCLDIKESERVRAFLPKL